MVPVTTVKELLFQELLAKSESAICTSDQLEGFAIPPRKQLVGKWMREGDLGFLFGERGSGKTWLVECNWDAPEHRERLV
jgi:hypothetical protein